MSQGDFRPQDRCVQRTRPTYRAMRTTICAGTLAGLGLTAGCGGDEPSATTPAQESTTKNVQTSDVVVARMETVVPDEGEIFLLHGTLPLPPNVDHPDDGTAPIAVCQPSGAPIPTQIEGVSRYADSSKGNDVVEVMAWVPRPEGAESGDRVQYDVKLLQTPHPEPELKTYGLAALVDGTTKLHPELWDLILQAGKLELRSRDVFGNDYRRSLVDGGFSPQVLKHGYYTTQVRTHRVMKPVPPKSGSEGTLPHLLGVHSYLSVLRNEPVVLVDLRIHNGFANTESVTSEDNVVHHAYFDGVDLHVPSGWSVVQAFEDTASGAPFSEPGKKIFPLIAPNTDGTMHVMPMGGQTVRRLALCPTGLEHRAEALLAQEGLAFSVPGFDAGSGQDLWSWSNPQTARFLVQNMRLPDLEFANLATIRGMHTAELGALSAKVAAGTGQGNYPLLHGKLGWAHPYGVAYGGMTGGDEIHLFEGVDVVQARSVDGYRHYQLLHRMHTDRQPNVLYRKDGVHASLWDWFVENGENSYVPLVFYMKYLNGPDPIGVTDPPTDHIEAVYAQEKVPVYQSELLSYDAHDLQHLIRYTRSPKALVWIGNESLAKDDLMAQAELVRLSYHPYYSDPYGNKVETGMREDIEQTEVNPGGAIDFGRGEGWATDTRLAAYAVASEEWRQLEYPMLETLAEMLSAGQVPCNGHIMAFTSHKIFEGKYRAAQAYETSIVDNAIRGLLETAFRGRSASMTALTEAVLVDNYYGFIGPTAWSPGATGPREQYAVAPTDNLSQPYCNEGQQPDDGITYGSNKYQTWSTLGFAYDLTGDPIFLQKAQEMIGGELWPSLAADGISNIENRTALLSVAQELEGLL